MKFLTILAISMLFTSCNINITRNIEKHLPQSDLIIEGVVLQKNTTIMAVSDVSNLLLLKVSEVFDKIDEYDILRGDTIVVKVIDMNKHKVGDKKFFIAKKWSFGNAIGVIELSNNKTKLDASTLKSYINREKDKLTNLMFTKNIIESEIIVTGKIIKTIKDSVKIGLTEHDPEWIRATIAIDSVLKGTQGMREVEFLFSSSNDIMWYFRPKFNENDIGIWVLSKPSEIMGYPQNQNFVIIDKNDKMSIELTPNILKITNPKTIKKRKK